jgi:hypothetical protein
VEELDPVVWTMGKELQRLDCSFNRITYFPSELGDLKLLVELNCSCNKLGTLPCEIGKCKFLRLLKCNGNLMTEMPDEIGNCSDLEEIVASENLLGAFPWSVGRLQKLRVLRLQTNKLGTIPSSLADIPTLEEVNCDNNPTLHAVVPTPLQKSSHFILWLCKTRRDHGIEVERISGINSELSVAVERALDIERKLSTKLLQESGTRSEIMANSERRSVACAVS